MDLARPGVVLDVANAIKLAIGLLDCNDTISSHILV